MEQVCEGEKCDFAADLFPSLLEQGVPMYGLMCTGHWCDIGTAEAYYAENMRGGRRNIFSRLGESHIDGSAELDGVVVYSGVTVGALAQISGSVLCPRCRIGGGARICDGCIVGEGAVIGEGAILLPGTLVGSGENDNPCRTTRQCPRPERNNRLIVEIQRGQRQRRQRQSAARSTQHVTKPYAK